MSRFTDKRPIIYLITDGTLTDRNFQERSPLTLETIKLAVQPGIPLVQIREKQLSAKKLCELAEKTVEIARNTETQIMINDRADIAAATGADGVQLTEESLPVPVIRQTFPELIVGVSTHSSESVAAAAKAGADFAVFGPVFETPGKERWQGLSKLRQTCEPAGDMPVLAIGGIDDANYQEVLAAGASGFAAIRFLNDAGNLSKIKEMLESAS